MEGARTRPSGPSGTSERDARCTLPTPLTSCETGEAGIRERSPYGDEPTRRSRRLGDSQRAGPIWLSSCAASGVLPVGVTSEEDIDPADPKQATVSVACEREEAVTLM